MNIFATSKSAIQCAEYLDDKRVVKMVLETAQLLATSINLCSGKATYKSTHINHPCAIWAKTIKVQKDQKTGDHFLKLEDFVDVVDIKKVKYYTLELIDDEYDKCMLLKFYDSKKKVINCKEDK